MLEAKTLDDFVRKVNQAHQQFCVWMYTNNNFAKYQKEWNEFSSFMDEGERSGCKYKNFWNVVIPSLQQGWILSLARLFDPAYHSRDKKKDKPRLSLEYILDLLDDVLLAQLIRERIRKYETTIQSLKNQRNNFLAHNDVTFKSIKIEAGIENLFEELDSAISDMKHCKSHLQNCNNSNLRYTEVLSHCGVDEILEALLRK